MTEITTQQIKELRDKTGVSVMECKKALSETGADVNKAIEYLKHRGIALAETKKDKATTSGRVGSYIHSNGKIGVLVELGCETDFVANNEEFLSLLKDISMQIAAMSPIYVSRDDVPAGMLQKEKEYYRQEAYEQNRRDGKEKPAAVIDKIVEGKLDKFFYSQKCLLEQVFIKDETVKIADLIKNKIAKFGENIVVRRFQRFEIGK